MSFPAEDFVKAIEKATGVDRRQQTAGSIAMLPHPDESPSGLRGLVHYVRIADYLRLSTFGCRRAVVPMTANPL